jgi:hypothetical protein
MFTLQINTKGAWRNVLDFEARSRGDIVAGLKPLARVLGDAAKWSVLHDDGRREWLVGLHLNDSGDWRQITVEQPPPLVDVMVSVFGPDDEEPMTFMAFRKQQGANEFFVSGAMRDERVNGAYAWCPVMDPAPLGMGLP